MLGHYLCHGIGINKNQCVIHMQFFISHLQIIIYAIFRDIRSVAFFLLCVISQTVYIKRDANLFLGAFLGAFLGTFFLLLFGDDPFAFAFGSGTVQNTHFVLSVLYQLSGGFRMSIL